VLGLSECVALVWPDNNASTHVLSKLRFQYEGSSVYYGNDVNVFVRALDV
jgi:RimJ/RimL family protein N-acetyltransferase